MGAKRPLSRTQQPQMPTFQQYLKCLGQKNMICMLRAHREVCRQHEKLSEPVWGEPFVGTTYTLATKKVKGRFYMR